MHKFAVGQSVVLTPTVLRPSAAGAYDIRCLLPASDGNPENPRYRIKSVAEKHERVAFESELTLTKQPESGFCINRGRRRKAGLVMPLSFPNFSRSYDSTRNAVRFWGYDSAMETSFYIMADALRHLQPGTPLDEAGLLQAFDSNRDRICAAAAKAYKRGLRSSYDLGPAAF
jgi:hypothetical protein